MASGTTVDRPNFLIIMSDEHGPMFSSAYGHPLVQTPNMDRLARRGATFDAAYCNAPLCVPSRYSFMTGQFVSKCQGWDNATPLAIDAMTWPYLLRSRDYDAVLSGKMHLIGPDPLHGFRAQLAYDLSHGISTEDALTHRIQAAGQAHTNLQLWRKGVPTADEPFQSVKEARAGTFYYIETDDAVEAAALEYLRDPGRKDQPFALCVGFITPHYPFIVPEPYFSMYYPDNVDLPNLPDGHLENLPPAARRLSQTLGFGGPYSEDEILSARAAYFGMITFMDAKIGRLLDTLEEQGLSENTVVIYTSDHGEMAGEHGLWRKMSFYEQSSRVPLQISWPGVVEGGQRMSGVTSLVDVTATILDMVGMSREELAFWDIDGDSLLALMRGETGEWKDEAFAEHLAHGTDRAMAMVRQGKWKLCYNHGDPPEFELYDLESDPGEFTNLADDPDHRETRERLFERVLEEWGDPDHVTRQVISSQERIHLIAQVLGRWG